MKLRPGIFVFGLLLAFTGCGGSGSSSIINPPPVQAQTGYSNASLNGTYSIVLSGSGVELGIGSFKADGNGNFSSGSLSMSFPNGTCAVTFSGAYSLQNTAAGTASINPVASGTCGVPMPSAMHFLIQAAQQGSVLLFAPAGTDNQYTGTAAKQ